MNRSFVFLSSNGWALYSYTVLFLKMFLLRFFLTSKVRFCQTGVCFGSLLTDKKLRKELFKKAVRKDGVYRRRNAVDFDRGGI